MKTTSAIVKLLSQCNNRCAFCHCHGQDRAYARPTTAFSKLLDVMPATVSRVLLSGGEPSIYPRLDEVLQELELRGLQSGFITNGRRFAYQKFCQYALSKGANYFYISLHSHLPELHDGITGVANSWNETWAGIRNLSRLGSRTEIIVNCVVNKANGQSLPEFVSMLAGAGIQRVKFSVPEIKGLAAIDQRRKLLPLEDAATHITEAIEHGDRLGLRCVWDGLPLCHLSSGLRERQDTLEGQAIHYMAELTEDTFYFTDESNRCKSSGCRFCSYHAVCRGYYRGYEELYGVTVIPLSCPVPNSFSLFCRGDVAVDPSTCFVEEPHHFPVSPLSLALFDGDHGRIFEAESSFFKRDNFFQSRKTDQFYLKVDPKEQRDRVGDLRQLSRLPVCRGCRNGCLGMYQSRPFKPFFCLSPRMAELLNDLSGHVLDVGFGEIYLSDLLLDRQNNPITYIGIDPSETVCEFARTRYPGSKFLCCTLEDADFADDSFDFILLLGSYAHIRDIERGLENARRLLGSRGKLIIIENSVFGLLRHAEEIPSRETGSNDRYEHYRNDNLDDAAEVLSTFGFSVLEKEDISSSCNLWMLVATPSDTTEGSAHSGLSSESP